MIPITLALIVVQEMCARMGVVTGKGLSDLIREEFGLRMTFVVMILLVIVNFGNVVTEFIGIAGSMQLFHVSRFLSVPICAAIVWALVVKGDYKSVEKVFLVASFFYFAYIVAGVLSGPNWHLAMVQTVKLPPASAWHDRSYLYMTLGVIGTTIAPWMQFYLQSSVVDKGITVKEYKASRLDVIIGSIFPVHPAALMSLPRRPIRRQPTRHLRRQRRRDPRWPRRGRRQRRHRGRGSRRRPT